MQTATGDLIVVSGDFFRDYEVPPNERNGLRLIKRVWAVNVLSSLEVE